MEKNNQLEILGWVMFCIFVLAAVFFGVTGCALFASTTPRSEIAVERWSVDDAGNPMKLSRAVMAGQWMEGEFTLALSQGFTSTEGRELMTSQTLTIRNLSLRPEAALQVAIERAKASKEVSKEIIDALEKVAALFAAP